MQKNKVARSWVSIFLIAWGVFLILEGFKITRFGSPASDTPYWLISIAGLAICCASILVLLKEEASRWRDFMAGIVTALMGTMSAWVALFSSESNIDSNISMLSGMLDIPIGRIMFGIGALVCCLITIYALKLFYKKSTNT